MPYYHVQDTNSGDEKEVFMLSFSAFQEYLDDNSHLKQVFRKFPGVCDPVSVGATKVDAGFRDVLDKAKSAHRGSTVKN